MNKETIIDDAAFINVLDNVVRQFSTNGTVEPETAKEIAYQIMTKIGVQKIGYEAVEESLRVHYGAERKKELDTLALARLIVDDDMLALGVPFMLAEHGPQDLKGIRKLFRQEEVKITRTLPQKLEKLVETGVLEFTENLYSLTEDMAKMVIKLTSKDNQLLNNLQSF